MTPSHESRTFVTLPHRGRIVEFAAKHRVPAIYQIREFTDAGGLMSYGLK